MTNEERELISQFVSRVGGTGSTGGFARAVPSTQPALPPIDPEADRFIADQFASHPEARYRVTQMAVVQEAALAEAANRIQRLQAELEQTRQQVQQVQQAPQSGQKPGFFGSLFGGGGSAPAQPQAGSPWNQGSRQAPPQQYAPSQQYAPAMQQAPQYPPNMQPGMFQQKGSGFLGSALTTVAGVAGGMVVGNMLTDMFTGHGNGMFGGQHGSFGGGAGGMGMPNETTVINNYGDAAGQGGGWDNASQSGGGGDPAWDNSSQGTDPGWTDNSGGGGGGWDDNSSGGGGFDDNSL